MVCWKRKERIESPSAEYIASFIDLSIEKQVAKRLDITVKKHLQRGTTRQKQQLQCIRTSSRLNHDSLEAKMTSVAGSDDQGSSISDPNRQAGSNEMFDRSLSRERNSLEPILTHSSALSFEAMSYDVFHSLYYLQTIPLVIVAFY